MQFKKLTLLNFIAILNSNKSIKVTFVNSPPEKLEYTGQAGKIHTWFAWSAAYDSVIMQILIDIENVLHIVARLER